jgi:hypothetical protein
MNKQYFTDSHEQAIFYALELKMADEADNANETVQLHFDAMLNAVRTQASAVIPIEHTCRFCGGATDGRRWCDSDCCSAWQQEQRKAKW